MGMIKISEIKFTVIGAGSSYTPELIEGLSKKRNELPLKEIVLMDIDEKRLNIMTNFCKRFLRHLKYDVKIKSTINRRKAIAGADFVNTQIRVGGNAARINDEKIPLKYGLIGQETTGPGGLINALRTIPVMIEIARDVEKYSPDAWIVNYTNPTGLITEAITKYTNTKIAGFCSGGIFPKLWAEKALDINPSSVYYDYIGLNHMNFAFNIKVAGREITEEEFIKIAKINSEVDIELSKKIGLIMSPYLQYYYHTSKKVEELSNAELSRGEQVKELEKEIFAAYADDQQYEKPKVLDKRGGGGYSEVAIGFMDAVYNDRQKWMVVNVPNNGTIDFLPDDAVVEIACLVNKSGIHPLKIAKSPKEVWGIISAVKNYEQLAVEAAITGDKDTALMALIAHPLVRDYNIADPLLNELLETNKEYLPNFSKIN